MGYTIHFERGQSDRQKRAALHLCGFTLLDDTKAVVCSKCGAPAVWLTSAKAGQAAAIGCSNPACSRAQPPAGTGREG
jgi:hypothetical protein